MRNLGYRDKLNSEKAKKDRQKPSNRAIYECDDCGCIFEIRILRHRTKNESLSPHLIQWAGDVNNCCHCGGTMIENRPFLTPKELATLNEMVQRLSR